MLKEIFEQPESLGNTLRGHLLEDEGTARVSGLNMTDEELLSDRAHHHHGVRHLVAQRAHRRIHARRAGARCRSRSSTPRSSGTGTRWWTTAPSSSASASRARRRTPSPPSVRPSAAGRGPSAWSTWWAAPSRARWTAALYLHAGPEVGVASTKAFTSQVAALALLTLRLGRLRNLSILQGRQFIQALTSLPAQIEQILAKSRRGRGAGRAVLRRATTPSTWAAGSTSPWRSRARSS